MMDGFHEDKYPSFLASQWEKPMPQSCPVGQSTIHTAVSNATVTMNPSMAPFLPFLAHSLPPSSVFWDHHPDPPDEPRASQNLL